MIAVRAFFENRYLLSVTMALVLAAGVSALLALPRQEDPRITQRFALIITPFPGASAARVEALVTEPIENEIRQVSEVKHVESTSRAGVSIISVELQDRVGADTNEEILSEVRDRLADAEARLPVGAGPSLFDDQRGAVAFTLIVGVAWAGPGEPRLGQMSRVATELADELRNVTGTEIVRLYGDVREEITVALDPERIVEVGLSPGQVAEVAEASDSKRPAGLLRSERHDLALEVDGAFHGLERVAAVPLARDGEGQVVRVGDVADLQRGWADPPAEVALADGRRAVLVAARMGEGQKIGAWDADAQRVVQSFRRRYGGPILLDTVFAQRPYTLERLGTLASNLLLGVLVVIGVVLLTMGWRSALLVGMAVPLVASLTLFGIQVTGGALHQMAIFGMIISLGLLIDNAIVVVDETRKRMTAGEEAAEAVRQTARHLMAPLSASTLTTVLAFAPIVLLPGNAGDFVGYIGYSVIFAIVASFAVAMTLILALTGWLGPGGVMAGDDEGENHASRPGRGGAFNWLRDGISSRRLESGTRRTLRWGLKAPVAALLLAASPALLGFSVWPTLGRQFFPPTDRDMFELKLWLPPDASIKRTRSLAGEVEAALREDGGVDRVDWLLGGSFPSVYYNLIMNKDNSPFYAHGIVKTASPAATERLIPLMQARLGERFPGAQLVLREFGQGPPIPADVQYRLYGPSLDRLQDLGEIYRRELQMHREVLHTSMTAPRGQPKLWLAASEDEARLAGLSLDGLAAELSAVLEGVPGGSLLEDRESMGVRVRYASGWRESPARIASTSFVQPEGRGWSPLGSLGELELRPEPAGVTHYDGLRTNIVEAYTRSEALPIDVTRDVLARLEASGFALPEGYRLELGGALQQDEEAIGNLLTSVPVLVVLMISSLILVFRSVRLAVVLLAVAVLSMGFALLATWSIGFPVSFNTILGTLGLIGVALNDSIVVMAAIRANPEAAAGDHEAIVAEVMGCGRHVLSTTLTTIGGFLPLLLFVGGDFWPSLAIVLAGGVAGATLVAMLFVPASYALFHRTGPAGRTAGSPARAGA